MISQALYSERVAQPGWLELRRPAALNALSGEMIQACLTQLQAWQADSTLQAVVISAEGRAFCAGGDVRWAYAHGREQLPQVLDFFEKEYHLNGLIGTLGKPYIALMQGITMGGGAGISLHGSHPIATESFSFAMPETSIGLFPDVGMCYLLSRLPPGVGAYLALTGKRLTAFEALALGLVAYVIPDESLLLIKQQLRSWGEAGAPLPALEDIFQAHHLNHPAPLEPAHLIAHCFNRDTLDAIMSALRASDHPWAKETLDKLMTCSPFSLQVTLTHLQRAASLSLEACLAQDRLLVEQCLRHPDFYEGVRARLIDKDNQPRWARIS